MQNASFSQLQLVPLRVSFSTRQKRKCIIAHCILIDLPWPLLDLDHRNKNYSDPLYGSQNQHIHLCRAHVPISFIFDAYLDEKRVPPLHESGVPDEASGSAKGVAAAVTAGTREK